MSIDIDLVLVKSEAFALQIPRAGSCETCEHLHQAKIYMVNVGESHKVHGIL